MNRTIKQNFNTLIRSKKVWYCLFFYFSIIYLETMAKIFICPTLFDRGFFFMAALSLPIALIAVICSSWGTLKINRIIATIFLSLFTFLIMVQIVYYTIFGTYFTIYSFIGATKAATFWREALNGIADAMVPLVFATVPLLFWFFLGRKWSFQHPISVNIVALLIFIAVTTQITAYVIIETDTKGVMSRRYLYSEAFIPKLALPSFGVLTTYGLDIKNLTVGMTVRSPQEQNEITKASDYPYNILDINFDDLMAKESNSTIENMHQYFSNVSPTAQNEYTGKYKGKNLILICAEGFSSWALDKEKTPTLYRLANEGYVFKNFYNPIWNVSTSDGEYTLCTGLLPKAGVWSLTESSENNMPFCLGNQLNTLDYTTKAYHNHSYRYYNRDKSHPNMGYTYKGYGNGLDVTWQWPESDVEMMNLTVPEYVNNDLFHTYYMTVSGHLEYNFTGNAMALKHKDEVADLPYTEAGKAYIACQMEFDQAIEDLINQLEQADKLDDTLIVISGDHYPYGLTEKEIDDLNGSYVERNSELYRSSLILWDNTMEETVEIEKPCSPIDVLPTLSNLLGLPFDSRLLMGKDIFSTADGLVVFADHSWLTEKGRYNATENKFYPNKGIKVEDDYASKMMAKVNAMFQYSEAILTEDYYNIVLPDGEEMPKTKESLQKEKQQKQLKKNFDTWKTQLPTKTEKEENLPLPKGTED